MIGLTDDETFPLVLPRHQSLPADKRPTLRFRFITGRQRIAIEAAFEQTEGQTNSAYMTSCYDAIRRHLAGWSNVGVEYDPARFEDVVSWEDLLRIKAQWSFAALEYQDQKKSNSPSP